MTQDLSTLRITDGKQSFELWVDGGESGISEDTVTPSSIFVAGGGPGRYGDGEPLFATNEQRTWEGGRAQEFFADDTTRFLDAKNTWSLTPGRLGPVPQWFFGRGYRAAEFYLPGDLTWQGLYGDTQYLSQEVTPTTTITADKAYVWVRRVGIPTGNLTLEVCSDTSDAPGSVLKTATIDTDTITDTISVFQVFDWTTTQSLTGTTKYHIKVYGAANDSATNHWQIGVDTGATGSLYCSDDSNWLSAPHKMYYRVVAADVNVKWHFFMLDGALYAVSQYADQSTASKLFLNGARGEATAGTSTTLTNSNAAFGTSSEYVGALVKIIRGTGVGQVREIASHTATALTVTSAFDVTPSTDSEYVVYQTPRWTELTSTDLGVVKSVAVYNNIANFAQGPADPIRRFRFNAGATPPAHEYDDDGSLYADLLFVSYRAASVNKPVLWRVLSSNQASVAPAVAWSTDHTFGTAIECGDSSYPITNFAHGDDGELLVFKSDQLGKIGTDDKYTRLKLNLDTFPESTNGLFAMSHGLYTYFSWSWSMEQYFNNAVDDIDPNREAGLPFGRQGYVSCGTSHPVGPIVGIDANTGTSSVSFYDGINYHEVLRAFEANKRIRSLHWQANEGGKKYLWVGVGDDLIYQEYPRLHRNPFKDDTQKYMHEFVLTTSTYDMGNASIYKVWRDLSVVTRNLGADCEIFLDYQSDGDIDTDNWNEGGAFSNSPLDTVQLNIGQSQQIRFRLRGYTRVATTAPLINAIVVKGVGQLPIKSIFTMTATLGDIAEKLGMSNAETLLRQIATSASKARVWTVEKSKYRRLQGQKVLVEMSAIRPDYSTGGKDNTRARITMFALDDVA